jgi:capsular polysaccharide biosynthesis protein
MTRFLVKLVKYWYLYLIPILLIPTAATLYGLKKETVYESNATIYVQTNTFLKDFQSADDNSFATKAQNVSDAMGQLLQTETFLVSVARDTSLKNVYDLGSSADQDAVAARIAGNITVSANNTRNIVFVTAADRASAPVGPQVAKELAGAVITEFVAFYANQELATLTQAQDFYGKQLDDITAKVADDTKKVSDYQKQHPEVNTLAGENDPAYVELKTQREADQATQKSAQSNADVVAQAMEAAKTGTSYDVKPLDPPTLPKSATVKISKVVVYPIGALVALLALLALIAGVQTKLDRRVYDRQDIEGILDKLEWDPTAVEVMPIISTSGGRGSISWDDRENSPVPALMLPVLAALPRPARKQLRSGTTQAPRRESQPKSARRSSYIEDEP